MIPQIVSMHSLCTNINTGQHTQQSLFEPFQVAALGPIQGKKVTLDFQGGSKTLRKDPALKMALYHLPDSGLDLASQPTFSRLENMVTRSELYRMTIGFLYHFRASYTEEPPVIVLDFDDTDDVVHGKQQLALFSGYHQETCYQPMHVFEGLSGKLITSILRPGPASQ